MVRVVLPLWPRPEHDEKGSESLGQDFYCSRLNINLCTHINVGSVAKSFQGKPTIEIQVERDTFPYVRSAKVKTETFYQNLHQTQNQEQKEKDLNLIYQNLLWRNLMINKTRNVH